MQKKKDIINPKDATDAEIKADIAKRVREMRKKLNLSASQIAKKLGISREAVAMALRGIGGAHTAAETLPKGGAELIEAARGAYADAMLVTSLLGAAIVFIAAVFGGDNLVPPALEGVQRPE